VEAGAWPLPGQRFTSITSIIVSTRCYGGLFRRPPCPAQDVRGFHAADPLLPAQSAGFSLWCPGMMRGWKAVRNCSPLPQFYATRLACPVSLRHIGRHGDVAEWLKAAVC